MESREEQERNKREERRKRRVRNQVIAYSVLGGLILVLAAGITLGAGFLLEKSRMAREKEEEEQQEKQDKIEEIFSTEEPIVMTTEPVPETAEPTWEEKLDEIVNAGIEAMSLEDRVAGLFIVTPEAITGVSAVVQAGEGTREALERYAVGGLIYFQQNMQSEEQLREMLDNTKLYAKYPLFLAVDEEGGSVARVASAGIGPKVDSAGDIGATGDAQNAYNAGVTVGSTLSGLGLNLDFAPVADVAGGESSIMAGRSYGADAATAAGFAISMMEGLEEQKVTACLKHFPGIGSAVTDPHDGMSTTERSAEQFWTEDLTVFQAGIDAGTKMIMVSHMSAPSLSGDNEPSIFSKVIVTDILREQMDFQGVIITDAMNMLAISEYYGADEAAIMAVLAGCDMLLMPEDFEKAYNGVLQAVQDGIISEERINDSLRRIYRIKYADMAER